MQTAEGEYFIPASGLAGAFDGDLVEIAPLRARGIEGRRVADDDGVYDGIVPPPGCSVVDRAHDTLVGRYEVAEPFGVVVPADPRIPYDVFTMRAESPEVPDGALVRVRHRPVPDAPQRRHGLCGRGARRYLRRAGVPASTSSSAATSWRRCSRRGLWPTRPRRPWTRRALAAGYRDLRDRFTFTIDPADAKDFDDALSLDYLEGEGLWRLGVHIADVSHYVPWGSSVDLDARRRATSVYLADRVIPMLPPALSDELCSLAPGAERRSMTADLFLNDEGELVRFSLYPALIRSDARLSYGEADGILVDYKAAIAAGGDIAVAASWNARGSPAPGRRPAPGPAASTSPRPRPR